MPHTQILEHRSSKSSEVSHFKHRPWTPQTPTLEHRLYSVLPSHNLKNISKYLRHNIWNSGPQRVHRPHIQNVNFPIPQTQTLWQNSQGDQKPKNPNIDPLNYLRFKLGSSNLNEFRDFTDWTQNPNTSHSNFKPQIEKIYECLYLEHRPWHQRLERWNIDAQRAQRPDILNTDLKMHQFEILRHRPQRLQKWL